MDNNYYLEIIQKGLSLEVSEENLLHEFSGNIPIKIIKDEKYANWILTPYYVCNALPELNSVVAKEATPLSYDEETQEVVLPDSAFAKSGYIFISVSLADVSTKPYTVLYSGTVRIKVNITGGGYRLLKDSTVWEIAVLDYVDKYIKQNYTDKMTDLVTQVEGLIENNKELETSVITLQTNVNKLINDLNNAESERVQAENQRIEDEKKRKELFDEVQQKVNNGEFDGKTIIYGEGIPSDSLGRVGDLYINTSNEGEYSFGLFTKEESGWVYGWKMQGIDGTDTLPIHGTMFLPKDSEIPAGYEEVTDESYYIPANFVGSNEEDKLLDDKLNEIDNKIPVTEPSLASNSPTNVPTIEAVNKGFAAKQLLVNNSFQVNQRGQSEYTSNGGSLDCWHIVATSTNKISPIDDGGILINKSTTNQNIVRQYVDIENANIGRKYTMVINIESDKSFVGQCGFGIQRQNLNVEVGNKRYVYTFTLNETDINEKGKVDVLLINADNKVANAPKIKIWYADLFESDIAYHHVKNKYIDDLMECRRYLKVYPPNSCVCMLETISFKACRGMVYKGDMVNPPTFVHKGELSLYQFGEVYDTVKLITVSNNLLNADMLMVNVESINQRLLEDKRMTVLYTGKDGYIIMSCE